MFSKFKNCWNQKIINKIEKAYFPEGIGNAIVFKKFSYYN